MNDGTDPRSIPVEVRLAAISAAAETIREVLAAHDLHLDLARFETLEIALDDPSTASTLGRSTRDPSDQLGGDRSSVLAHAPQRPRRSRHASVCTSKKESRIW